MRRQGNTSTLARALEADKYKQGFVTDIEKELAPEGLSEDTVRYISAKKEEPEWMLQWRLEAFQRWKEDGASRPGRWSTIRRSTTRPRATTRRRRAGAKYKTHRRRPNRKSSKPTRSSASRCREQEDAARCRRARRACAVDAVFDSVSVSRPRSRTELAKAGVIFCSMSEAIREHPELVKKYLGSVVPTTDNFFATLNSAVFSDGSFVYVPPGVRCPMELSTYFRMNAEGTGQFERTLIIADKGAYVSYLEGCTAPMRDENQLHAAVVELVALDDAEIKYSTVQNWWPGDADGKGGIYNFVTKRGDCRGARSKISWTQVETGSAITWKYPSCILRGDDSVGRILFDRRHQRPPAGRHRHQDDPPGQEHALADHLQGHLRRQILQRLSRSRLGAREGVKARATTRSATRS